ncbi:tryptophan 7-halogenase [Croceibacterium aestuarii]|uniref:tryptophan 7-halogenase n=1 Tax=Croceibacterium aestuarii TaxID=3064139 RepID=UPI00272E3708|nr:tryptophan 7-halogenase [Croceibacterium sp. D39]
MSEPRELPARIVVAGDGPLGVLAAIGLRRALPTTELLVLALPPDPGAFAERIGTALPFTNRLHDRLQVGEDDLVRKAGASHRLVMRYFGGGGPGQQGAAGYGAAVDPAMATAFAREWGGGPRNAGTAAPPRSLGEVLAAAGRFAPPQGEAESPLADLDYALRWNVPAYRELLVGIAAQLGVQHARVDIRGFRPDGEGGIAALVAEGVGEIPGDLFVDCTGSRALLHSHLPEARQIDWHAMHPVRRIAMAEAGRPVLALEDRAAFTPLGWRWDLAGRDGLQTILGIAGEAGDEAISAALGEPPAAIVPFSPGRAEAPWLGNVVALGDAAARIEPLGGIAQDLAHRQLALLLELLPGRTVDAAERAEFNRRAALMADRAADWVAVHYAAPAAGELFPHLWRSPELERALDQYVRRGRTPFAEEAPMLVQEWGALLQALGVPSGESPLTAAAAGDENDGGRHFAARAEAALAAAPPYAEWVQELL